MVDAFLSGHPVDSTVDNVVRTLNYGYLVRFVLIRESEGLGQRKIFSLLSALLALESSEIDDDLMRKAMQ